MHDKRVDCFCACFAEPLLQGQQKLDPVELYHMISPVSIEHSALCDVANPNSQEGSHHSLDTG